MEKCNIPCPVCSKVEKADNGLTVGEHYENLLDKDKIFDLDTIFKDTWAGPKYTIEYKTTKGGKGTFYFNSIKKLFETLKVQYKTSLLDRLPKPKALPINCDIDDLGDIRFNELLASVKSLIEGAK